jgi:hypothetical protein
MDVFKRDEQIVQTIPEAKQIINDWNVIKIEMLELEFDLVKYVVKKKLAAGIRVRRQLRDIKNLILTLTELTRTYDEKIIESKQQELELEKQLELQELEAKNGL